MKKTELRWLSQNRIILFFSFIWIWILLAINFLKINFFSRKIRMIAKQDIEKSKPQLEFSNRINFRIWQYVIFHGLLAYVLADFKGRKPKQIELKRFFLLSVCAPLFDDLTDHWNLSDTDIKNLLSGNRINSMPEIASSMASKYLQRILKNTNDDQKHNFYNALQHLIQEQSKTKNTKKGVMAFLLYSSLMEDQYSESEMEWMQLMGQLGQKIDDIFDYHKDLTEGISTWANQYAIQELKIQYRKEIDKMIRVFSRLSNRTSGIYFYWSTTILLSTPLVALDQFSKDNTDAICDMERFPNRLKLVYQSWKLGVQLNSTKEYYRVFS